ncbi:tetratricopeptide repeat protein [Roseateles sp. BYS180W]|uniref:Tetratricopeptide repeat protein n=1 Tax=Roseateles rivi TaxID=3299028 RepID=A0ABW7FRX1_9BURK
MSSVFADDVGDVLGLLNAGKHAEALKKTDQLLAANPGDARLQLQRGIALSALGRKNEAITVFQKLIEAHPDHPGPYNNLAVLYASQGDYDKARQSLELAIKTNPSYATAFQNLGDVYARLAGQAYKKALALDKNDVSLPLKLAVIQNVFEPTVDPRPGKAAKAPVPAPAPAPVAAAKPVAPVAPAPAPVAAAPKPAAPVAAAPAAPVAAATAPAKPTAAAPAPAPVAKASADSDQKEIEKALKGWAQSWSRRDMDGYFAAYSPEFKGKSGSRKAWESDRRNRILSKKKISVEISDLDIKIDGNKAKVRFRQDYNSDSLDAKSTKNVELTQVKPGQWRITAENSN